MESGSLLCSVDLKEGRIVKTLSLPHQDLLVATDRNSVLNITLDTERLVPYLVSKSADLNLAVAVAVKHGIKVGVDKLLFHRFWNRPKKL